MNQDKILITGGCGFIATNFIHYIYKKYPNLEIFNLDCLDFPITANNHSKLDSDRYHFVQGSILDKALLEKLFKQNKFSSVINFAAKTHVDNSISSAEEFTITNVLGVQTLLDFCLRYEISKYLQISTDEVYGSLNLEDESTTEESNLKPNNPYSASKAGADCLVRSYFRTYQMPCLITRSSNNFGPYQYPEKLIPVVISNSLNDTPIPVYGQGGNVRDWIFVEDNCRALDLVLNKGKFGEIYNIPGNKEIDNLQLIKMILQILDKPKSLISFVQDRKGHDIRYSMNGEKLSQLGYQPSVDFMSALTRTIEWYKTHPDWLRVKLEVS